MEKLPDGFTKIRSKNLDVLFKRDYYAQRADGSVVVMTAAGGTTSDGGCSSRDAIQCCRESHNKEVKYL